MFEPQLEQMPFWIRASIEWLNGHDVISKLLVIMLLDMVSGIMKAIIQKRLNSTTSWAGMCRKVFILILISVCAILDPLAGGLPVSKLASIAFIVAEAISILENAVASGVPVPQQVRDMLEKLNREQGMGTRPPVAVVVAPNSGQSVTMKLPDGAHLEMKADIPPSSTTSGPKEG